MSLIKPEDFLADGSKKISQYPTEYKGGLDKDAGEALLAEAKEELHKLQDALYADGSQALLIVLQAMDAAGKDSLIEHTFGGINPQGCQVTSFKSPSEKEYKHDFLWRHYTALPEKGMIGIFNRSHYESVLVCKVHPEYNLNEKVWKSTEAFDEKFWQQRYESIRDFEKHIARNGTTVIKFFLNVSKDEQKKRFLDRIQEPDKNWKFSYGDVKVREEWEEYQKAYAEAIANTHDEKHAPWYILPADNKWFTRLAAIRIIIETIKKMHPQFPELSGEQKALLEKGRAELEKE